MASKNVVEIILSAKDQASKIVKEVFREFQDSAATSSKAAVAALATASTAIAASMAVIGAAATAGFGYAVKSAADFEQSLADVKSVMSPDEVKQFSGQLKELALQMGADTKYSATEAAQGIEELIKAGVGVSEIMNGGLKGALSLATAGGLELAEAAEIASTALNAFKKDGLNVQQAADILAGAANASATSVGELKYGLSSVAAVASGVGISFKETSSALAVLAQNGLKGSDAGTSLKTMLLNLQPSTKDATAAFKELGIITKNGSNLFVDAQGHFKSITEISGILHEKLKDLTDAQRQQALETMFGIDAIRAANILFNEGAKGMQNMQEAMSKVGADDVAATKMNTLHGAIEQLKGSTETAAIIFGETFIPGVTESTKSIDGFISKMVESGQVKAFAETVKSVFDEVKEGVNAFVEIVKPAFDEWKSIFIDSGLATSRFKEYVLPTLQEVWAFIQKFAEAVGVIWSEWGDEIIQIATTVGNTVWSVLENVFGILNGLLDTFIGLFTGDWERMGEGLKKIWTNLWEGIGTILSGAWGILETAFGGLYDSISKWFIDLVSDAKQWGGDLARGFSKGIRDLISEPARAALEMGQKVGKTLREFFGIHSPSKLMAEYGAYIVEGLAKGMDDKQDLVTKISDKLAQAAHSKLAHVKTRILHEIEELREKMKPSLDQMAQAINDAFSKVKDELSVSAEIVKAKFELMKAQMGDNADKSKILQAELKSLTDQLDIQELQIDIVNKAYEDMKKAKGENAIETQKLLLELTKEKVAYEELAQSIVKAKKAQSSAGELVFEGDSVFQRNSNGDLVQIGTRGIDWEGAKKRDKERRDRGEWVPSDHTDTHVGGFKDMPRYAKGTNFHPGGPAIVGEEGMEVVNLPRGASVTPNNQLDTLFSIDYDRLGKVIGEQLTQVLSKFSNSTPVSVEVYGNTFKDGHDLGNKLNDTLRRFGI